MSAQGGTAAAACLRAGAPQVLIRALPEKSGVSEAAANALANLACSSEGRVALAECAVVESLAETLQTGSVLTIEAVTKAFVNLTAAPEGAQACVPVVPMLVEALERQGPGMGPCAKLRAAWALGNLAWSSHEGCDCVVRAGGTEALVRLLELYEDAEGPACGSHDCTDNTDVRCAAVHALCNICDSSPLGLAACVTAGWSGVALAQVTRGHVTPQLDASRELITRAQLRSPLTGAVLSRALQDSARWPKAPPSPSGSSDGSSEHVRPVRGPDVPLDIDCMRFADIRVQVWPEIIDRLHDEAAMEASRWRASHSPSPSPVWGPPNGTYSDDPALRLWSSPSHVEGQSPSQGTSPPTNSSWPEEHHAEEVPMN